MSAPTRLTEAQIDTLAAWQFNVMLECMGTDEELKVALGGAILDLRELERLLDTLAVRHMKDKDL